MDDQVTQDTQTRRIAIALAIALALGAGGWWFWHRSASAKPAAGVAEAAPATVAAAAASQAAPAIKYPLTTATESGPVAAPALSDPDATAREGLASLFGEPALAEWLIPEQLLRRLVATADNLPRSTRSESLRPVRAPATPFAVRREMLEASTGTERITLSDENFARYDSAVAVLAKTDMGAAAKLYRQLYPLLQKAYEDLGYPDRYLNDRVVDTIDHLLATPEPQQPLLLEQPKVLYRYADGDLESRSTGQKLLLRMGVKHTMTIKQKLREFRAQIANKE
ncbi:MAG: DUF3014 domain-containing protein [Steroidobacteraceae bacterium]